MAREVLLRLDLDTGSITPAHELTEREALRVELALNGVTRERVLEAYRVLHEAHGVEDDSWCFKRVGKGLA